MRVSHDNYFLTIALAVARRSSCLSRQVGTVLVDNRNHILSTGYNGYASGTANCVDTGICARAGAESGTKLNLCEAIHGEANSLLQAPNVYVIETAYVTTSPCKECVKLLMNTSCKRIVFINPYPNHEVSQTLWESVGREWVHYKL
jgi:dCMP deaminase